MVLAKDEQVIKSWEYAHAKIFLDKDVTDCSLTVTNKRVINSLESKTSLTMGEVPLSKIKAVNGKYRKNKTFWAKIQLIFGIIFCCTIIGLIIGIPMVRKALDKLRACYLELNLITEGFEGSTLTVGAFGAVDSIKRGSLLSRIFHRELKIFVNKDVAKDILDTIGAVIIENK